MGKILKKKLFNTTGIEIVTNSSSINTNSNNNIKNIINNDSKKIGYSEFITFTNLQSNKKIYWKHIMEL